MIEVLVVRGQGVSGVAVLVEALMMGRMGDGRPQVQAVKP